MADEGPTIVRAFAVSVGWSAYRVQLRQYHLRREGSSPADALDLGEVTVDGLTVQVKRPENTAEQTVVDPQ